MFKKNKNYDYIHTTDFDFKILCELLANECYDLAIERVKVLVREIKIENLSFYNGSYTRNIIVNNNDHWLGLIYWDKGIITNIHGHPYQSFVYVVEGSLSCKNFDKNQLTELEYIELNNGEYCYNKGIKGRMDNNIHQINTKQKSISLHYYSDDPGKGRIFEI